MGQRKAVTAKLAAAYRRGSRKDKGRILDELCELTGWHRDWARTALRQAGTLRVLQERSPRRPIYSERVVAGLAICWRVARYPTGKRLAPMLAVLVAALRRDGELEMTDAEAAQLVAMASATIDRRLAPTRRAAMPHGRSHTKPGTLLKSQIPIRTWSSMKERPLSRQPPLAAILATWTFAALDLCVGARHLRGRVKPGEACRRRSLDAVRTWRML